MLKKSIMTFLHAKWAFCAALALCTALTFTLYGCADRNGPAPSSESDSESESVSESEASQEPEPASVEEEPEESESSSEAETYETPLLTDTEKTMLEENLELFIRTVGENALESPASLTKDQILAACTAEIDRTKDVNAYILMKNDEGVDLISAELVAETAQRLFGIENFDYSDSTLYDADTKSFLATMELEKAPKYTPSDMMGTEDSKLVAYEITFPDGGVYLYHTAIYRQNSMPYLQLVSTSVITPKTESGDESAA